MTAINKLQSYEQGGEFENLREPRFAAILVLIETIQLLVLRKFLPVVLCIPFEIIHFPKLENIFKSIQINVKY